MTRRTSTQDPPSKVESQTYCVSPVVVVVVVVEVVRVVVRVVEAVVGLIVVVVAVVVVGFIVVVGADCANVNEVLIALEVIV